MISLYDYLDDLICEDEFVGSSDRAIYKRLAQHKWNHIPTSTQEKHKKKYPGIPDNANKLIAWFKESNGKILKKEDEIISRGEWNQLEQVGEIENSLMSPHKWSYFDFICQNPREKKNKILVVLECSNSKPYCQDSSKQWYFSRFRSFADFACGAYGIVPEEYSQLYPVRMDEWAHSDESESVAFKYNLISCNRGYKYIKAMGYEKVIVYFQNPAPEEFMKWMKKMPGMEDKLIFVINEALFKKVSKNHPGFRDNWGLITTRMMGMPEAHEAFMKAMKSCLSGEDLERFKEIEKLIKDDDKSGQKKWCEETNQKFNIKPYLPHELGWPKKMSSKDIPNYTYTSHVTQKQVDEYVSWLKDWADKQNKKEIGDDFDFAKERLLFTPLDLLIDMYNLGPDKPSKLDIDELYWNMMKALEDVADEIGIERLNLDKYGRYKYLWVFSRCLKEKSRKEMIKYSDKVGLSQFYQNPLKR
jgi:hypothetical protein